MTLSKFNPPKAVISSTFFVRAWAFIFVIFWENLICKIQCCRCMFDFTLRSGRWIEFNGVGVQDSNRRGWLLQFDDFFHPFFLNFVFYKKWTKTAKNHPTEFLFLLFAYLGFLFNDCNAILSLFFEIENENLIFIEKKWWKKNRQTDHFL